MTICLLPAVTEAALKSRSEKMSKITLVGVFFLFQYLAFTNGQNATIPDLKVEVYLNVGTTQSAKWFQAQISPLLKGDFDKLRLRYFMTWSFIPWGETLMTSDEVPVANCSENDLTNCQANRIVACAELWHNKMTPRNEKTKLEENPKFLDCFYASSPFSALSEPYAWKTEPLEGAQACFDRISSTDAYQWIFQCTKQESKLDLWYQLGREPTIKNNVTIEDGVPRIRLNNELLDHDVNLRDYLCTNEKFANFTAEMLDCKSGGSSAVTITTTTLGLIIFAAVLLLF